MKICTKCEKEKDEKDFSKRKEKKNGKIYEYLRSWCKDCLNTKSKQIFKDNITYYIERNRRTLEEHRAFLQSIKDVPCLDCGLKWHYCVMEFDHLPQFTKEFTISRVSQRISRVKLLDEINKCDIICSNCHRIRTYKRKYGENYQYKKNRSKNDLINSFKEKPCLDCDRIYPYYVMDFDHRPDEIKEFNISQWMKEQVKTRERILAEISKCDVVCSNCHRIRSYLNKTWITN